MGKMLVIKGADFSTNGTSIVDPATEKLNKIKSAIEAVYVEHKYYSTAYVTASPANSGTTRNAFGRLTAEAIDFVPFVVTPKTGCKMAPIQADGGTSSAAKRWSTISWKTTAITFTYFDTYPFMGCNVAYTDNSEIASDTSIWDFIDVTLAE